MTMDRQDIGAVTAALTRMLITAAVADQAFHKVYATLSGMPPTTMVEGRNWPQLFSTLDKRCNIDILPLAERFAEIRNLTLKLATPASWDLDPSGQVIEFREMVPGVISATLSVEDLWRLTDVLVSIHTAILHLCADPVGDGNEVLCGGCVLIQNPGHASSLIMETGPADQPPSLSSSPVVFDNGFN